MDTLLGYHLRTLDALHFAIAQHNGIEPIVTEDNFSAKAALALGFTVDIFVD